MKPFVMEESEAHDVVSRYNEHNRAENSPRTEDGIEAIVNAILSVGERIEMALQNIEMNLRPKL